MRKKRHNYTPEEKVSILKRHLIDRVPISELCDEHQLQHKLFYDWQKQFFEQGAAAFTRQSGSMKAAEATEVQQLKEKLQRTEDKLQRKHEVLSELMEEHVKLKKIFPWVKLSNLLYPARKGGSHERYRTLPSSPWP